MAKGYSCFYCNKRNLSKALPRQCPGCRKTLNARITADTPLRELVDLLAQNQLRLKVTWLEPDGDPNEAWLEKDGVRLAT